MWDTEGHHTMGMTLGQVQLLSPRGPSSSLCKEMRGAEDRTTISVPLGLEPSTDTRSEIEYHKIKSRDKGLWHARAHKGTKSPNRAGLQDKGQGLGFETQRYLD